MAEEKAWFDEQAPEMRQAWHQFLNSVYETGTLDRKSKEVN